MCVKFKILAFIRWLVASRVAALATVTVFDYFNEFVAVEIPPKRGKAAILMAQLLIIATDVFSLFLCLPTFFRDNVVAGRVGKPDAGSEMVCTASFVGDANAPLVSGGVSGWDIGTTHACMRTTKWTSFVSPRWIQTNLWALRE